jgi:PQQ-dependent dehydrogenase (methanol/ethanol family)
MTPFPNQLYALDLRAGLALKWRYAPPGNGAAEGMTCCGAPTGGVVAAGDRLFLTTLDGHVTALDPENGAVVWDTSVAKPETGEILTMAPLVVRDQVIVGTSGDDSGARGALVALETGSGRQRWKVFSTGPDSDVGIGPSFSGFYQGSGAADRGVTTWPPSAWQTGGGGLAGPLVFDGQSDLLFQATGHPAPLNPDQRDGPNRWTSGLFARDPRTGDARWFDAMNPHDLYGMGAAGGVLLVESRSGPVLVHPDANGYLYVLDRSTGQILSAEPYLPVTATLGVDRATGDLIRDPRYAPHPRSTTRHICPAWRADSNALPAFSRQTGLLYLPVAQLCMDMEPVSTSYIPGTLFSGANVRMKSAPSRSAGAVIAWDLAAGRPAWTISEALPMRGGALATGGGVVFYGTLDGTFKAADARTGRLLWQFRTESGIVSRPVTYRGPDGLQYVTVLAGSGGLTSKQAEIDARDATAAHGLPAALKSTLREASGTLYVFKLP